MPPPIETLTVLESHQLLNYLLPKEGTQKQFRKGIRNYCMALLMLDAGLRVGEVCQLRKSDLLFTITSDDPKKPTCISIVQSLVIRPDIAKYKIERTVPLSSRVQNALKEISERVWETTDTLCDTYAFYLHDPRFHITTRQVQRIIADASLKSIGRAIHPHILRHTFGSRLMRKVNSSVVQALLGHKQLSSTQVYMHPNGDDMKQAIDSITEPAVTE
jgi:integrase/recombinase XerD